MDQEATAGRRNAPVEPVRDHPEAHRIRGADLRKTAELALGTADWRWIRGDGWRQCAGRRIVGFRKYSRYGHEQTFSNRVSERGVDEPAAVSR